LPAVGIGFRPEFLDFRRGIRVGNLEDNERITRLLKVELEARHGEAFVTERWGRGVYWQWIGYLPRASREAMPLSSQVSFGCSKFFLSLDTADKLFKCGMQVERGYVKAPPDSRACQLQADWDWHRLLRSLRPRGPMERELKRLVLREGFRLHGGSWESEAINFDRRNLPSVTKLRRLLECAPPRQWAGFQVYYAMSEEEVRATTGTDLVGAMLAVFREVTPVMNLCLLVKLEEHGGESIAP
jgi:hypothetical protein